jgi:hypothetical protein
MVKISPGNSLALLWLFEVGTFDFNLIFKNQMISLHSSLCTPKNIVFLEMWLLNANLNCIWDGSA